MRVQSAREGPMVWCCIEGWWRINWTLLETTQWSEHKRFLARGELGIRYLCLFVFKKTLDGGRMIVYEYGTRTRTRSKIIKRSKQNVEEIEITTITRGPGNLLGHVFSWYHSLWIILSDGLFIDIHVPTKRHLTVAEHNNVHLYTHFLSPRYHMIRKRVQRQQKSPLT